MPHFKKGSPEAKAYMASIRGRRGNPLTRKETAETIRLARTASSIARIAEIQGLDLQRDTMAARAGGIADVAAKYGAKSMRRGAYLARTEANIAGSGAPRAFVHKTQAHLHPGYRGMNPGDLFALDTRSTGPAFCDKCDSEIEDARLTSRGWACPECGASLGKIDPESFVEPGRAEKAFGKRGLNPHVHTSRQGSYVDAYTDEKLASRTIRVHDRGERECNPPMLILGNPGKSSMRKINPRVLGGNWLSPEFLASVVEDGKAAAHAGEAVQDNAYRAALRAAKPGEMQPDEHWYGRMVTLAEKWDRGWEIGNFEKRTGRKLNPLTAAEQQDLRMEAARSYDLAMTLDGQGFPIDGALKRGRGDGMRWSAGAYGPAGSRSWKHPQDAARRGANPAGDVAETILEQLGGNKFIAMTGAKNFVDVGGGLMFQIPTSNGINKVKIALGSDDLYYVEFWNVRGMNARMVGKREFGIYADNLRRVFENATGLRTSLGTMGRETNPLDAREAREGLGTAAYHLRLARKLRGRGLDVAAHEMAAIADGEAMMVGRFRSEDDAKARDHAWRIGRRAGLEVQNAGRRLGVRYHNPSSSAVKMRHGGARMLPARIANNPAFKREYAAYVRRHGCPPARVSVVNSPAGSPRFASAWGNAPEIKYDPASDASNKGPRVHRFGEDGGTKPYLVSSVEKGPRYLGLLGGTFRAGGEWILR